MKYAGIFLTTMAKTKTMTKNKTKNKNKIKYKNEIKLNNKPVEVNKQTISQAISGLEYKFTSQLDLMYVLSHQILCIYKYIHIVLDILKKKISVNNEKYYFTKIDMVFSLNYVDN